MGFFLEHSGTCQYCEGCRQDDNAFPTAEFHTVKYLVTLIMK